MLQNLSDTAEAHIEQIKIGDYSQYYICSSLLRDIVHRIRLNALKIRSSFKTKYTNSNPNIVYSKFDKLATKLIKINDIKSRTSRIDILMLIKNQLVTTSYQIYLIGDFQLLCKNQKKKINCSVFWIKLDIHYLKYVK